MGTLTSGMSLAIGGRLVSRNAAWGSRIGHSRRRHLPVRDWRL